MPGGPLKIVFLIFSVWALAGAAPGLPSEWLQIPTYSAGVLVLPPFWSVVSKDEAPAQNPDTDWILNVQDVLYAKAEQPGGFGAVLQIFAIWGTDNEGKDIPLPAGISTSGALLGDLIGVHYGNLSFWGEDKIETALEDLSVVTYGAELPPAPSGKAEFQYKCACLYNGEKLVLVLLKYSPEDEGFWHGQLQILLSAWVDSLTLTPLPVPSAETVRASLPLLPVISPSLPEPPQKAETQTQMQTNVQALPVSLVWLAVPLAALLFIVISLRWRLKNDKNSSSESVQPSGDAVGDKAAESAESVSSNATEADLEGFDRVYSILDRALSVIDTKAASAPAPLKREHAGPAGLPGMPDVIDTFEELNDTLGDLPALDTLKSAIFKTIELSAEALPVSQEKEAAGDRLVLQLCCDVIIDMLISGRYHICKGILNSEGEGLMTLYSRLNGLRAQKMHITSDDVEKEAEYIKICVLASGAAERVIQ